MAGGVPNLLLVVPAFGEFAGDIEPHGSGIRPGPVYWTTHRSQIERSKIRFHLRSGKSKQFAQQAGTQTPGRQDPLVIQAVHQFDQFSVLLNRSSAETESVARPCQDSYVAAEQVRGYVLYGPARRGGGAAPIVR